MKRNTITNVVATILMSFVLVGCGDSDTTTPSTAFSTTPSSPVVVTAKDFAFTPSIAEIKAGKSASVLNSDSTDHTFTFDDGSVDTGNIAPGASQEFTVNKPGTYKYHCRIHSTMSGTVTVLSVKN